MDNYNDSEPEDDPDHPGLELDKSDFNNKTLRHDLKLNHFVEMGMGEPIIQGRQI